MPTSRSLDDCSFLHSDNWKKVEAKLEKTQATVLVLQTQIDYIQRRLDKQPTMEDMRRLLKEAIVDHTTATNATLATNVETVLKTKDIPDRNGVRVLIKEESRKNLLVYISAMTLITGVMQFLFTHIIK